MTQDIKVGSKINVKVVKQPTNAAAAKTIVRLLSKDSAVQKENDRLRRARKNGLREAQRGGRMWKIRVVKQHPVAAKIGESGVIVATTDVLTDLNSVSRFVEVSKA